VQTSVVITIDLLRSVWLSGLVLQRPDWRKTHPNIFQGFRMKFFPAIFLSKRSCAASLFAVVLLLSANFARAQGGFVTAWGDQTNPPGNPTNVIAVVSGNAHNLALRSDGTVIGWGNNAYGQATVPAGLSNVVDISAGQDISLALKADGSLTNWGTSAYSQSVVPASASNVVQAIAGGFHILVLRADSTVFAWGLNDYGQTTIPVGLRNVIAIAAGNRHNVALKEDGTVAAWGGTSPVIANVPPGLSNAWPSRRITITASR
jgi:alpha-tubulin suppressor-like RCC1 family protein